ncbi:MAG: diguanylate cyclase [Chloroflexi bacterium]|nr:diguanylate cyclase [Chloroflexota bacterium]
MKRYTTDVPRTKSLAAALVVAAGLVLAAAALTDTGEARVLAPTLVALVCAVGLWRPKPFVSFGAALVGAVTFALVRWLVEGLAGLVLSVGTVAIGLFLLAYLAELLAAETEAVALARRHDALVIEELTPMSEAGVLKWRHARAGLEEEILRGRRYVYPVSLALIAVDNWPELVEKLGADQAAVQVDALAREAKSGLRPMDTVSVYGADRIAVVLPHTPLQGALAAVDKLRQRIRVQLSLTVRAGVSEFPHDASSVDELTGEAEAALEFAQGSELGVASRGLFGAEEPEPAASPRP